MNHILINDTNWLENSLSDTRQLGWSSSLKITWEYNSYKFHSQIDYQDFSLIKKGVEDGLHLNMGIKYLFICICQEKIIHSMGQYHHGVHLEAKYVLQMKL